MMWLSKVMYEGISNEGKDIYILDMFWFQPVMAVMIIWHVF